MHHHISEDILYGRQTEFYKFTLSWVLLLNAFFLFLPFLFVQFFILPQTSHIDFAYAP